VRKSSVRLFVELHVQVNPATTVLDGHLIGHEVKAALIAGNRRIQDAIVHLEPAARSWSNSANNSPHAHARGMVCQRAWEATVSVLVRNLEVPTHCSSIARKGNLMFHSAMNVIVTPSCSQEDGVATFALPRRQLG
jgi:hypothetical protein